MHMSTGSSSLVHQLVLAAGNRLAHAKHAHVEKGERIRLERSCGDNVRLVELLCRSEDVLRGLAGKGNRLVIEHTDLWWQQANF